MLVIVVDFMILKVYCKVFVDVGLLFVKRSF